MKKEILCFGSERYYDIDRSVGGRVVVRLYKDIIKKDYYVWILILEIDLVNGV